MLSAGLIGKGSQVVQPVMLSPSCCPHGGLSGGKVHAEGASVSLFLCKEGAGGTQLCTQLSKTAAFQYALMCTGCCPRELLSSTDGSWGKLCVSQNPAGPTDGYGHAWGFTSLPTAPMQRDPALGDRWALPLTWPNSLPHAWGFLHLGVSGCLCIFPYSFAQTH